jgi:hypothetical protein
MRSEVPVKAALQSRRQRDSNKCIVLKWQRWHFELPACTLYERWGSRGSMIRCSVRVKDGREGARLRHRERNIRRGFLRTPGACRKRRRISTPGIECCMQRRCPPGRSSGRRTWSVTEDLWFRRVRTVAMEVTGA